MELVVKASWLLLALIHASPAAVTLAPQLVQRLYGVEPAGEVGLLLVHRGFLFAALFVAALWALWEPDARRLVSLLLGVSMLGFLLVYARAGWPAGALRSIAIADAVGVIPLLVVSYNSWLGGTHH